MAKTAYIGLLILAVLVGLFIGYCLWIPTLQIPYLLKYDILKDTLTIVLAVLAVGIAVIGYAIYLILSGRLEIESALTARLETLKGSIRLFVHSGFVFWESYDKTKKKESQYLEMAIGLTERALLFFNELPDNEAKNRENDKLLCKIKNNLAYYYAERKKPEDSDLAKEYAEYIRKRMSKYSEEKDNWLDTCNFVYQRYQS